MTTTARLKVTVKKGTLIWGSQSITVKGDVICCADDYFIVYNDEGVYKFDKSKLGDAHAWCKHRCETAMMVETPKIIIANTNTTESEFQPYIRLAETYGYDVHSIIIENRHGNSNIHNVPNETLEKMRNRFKIQL